MVPCNHRGRGGRHRGKWFQRQDLLDFIDTLYEGDLHAKRVLTLAKDSDRY